MPLLAFATSCDETSASVIHEGRVLSNVVSSQTAIHAEYGGGGPELAAREHLKNLMPVTQAAFRESGITADQLQATAATQGPGLPSALMVGLKAAQAMAFVLRTPFFGINHHEAHLYSPWIKANPHNQKQANGPLSPSLSPSEGEREKPEADPHNQKRANGPLSPSLSSENNTRAARFAGSSEGEREKPQADFSEFEPNVSLIVSGGHTMLVHVEAELRHRLLGSTLDDAAGECFDKTGKLMGLPYPAGPEMDRLAEGGNAKAFDFPRPMMNEPNDDFSFSGLKTSVRYFLRDNPALLEDAQRVRNLCASVQAAIVDVLVAKTIRAARRLRVGCVTASGGVTCNRALRQQLATACERERLKLRLAETTFCTDNAAMIGILAERKLAGGADGTSLDADILPGWTLAN